MHAIKYLVLGNCWAMGVQYFKNIDVHKLEHIAGMNDGNCESPLESICCRQSTRTANTSVTAWFVGNEPTKTGLI